MLRRAAETLAAVGLGDGGVWGDNAGGSGEARAGAGDAGAGAGGASVSLSLLAGDFHADEVGLYTLNPVDP